MLKYQDILTAFTKHANAVLPEGAVCTFRVEQPADRMLATLQISITVGKKRETFVAAEPVEEKDGSYRDALEQACIKLIFTGLMRGLLPDKHFMKLLTPKKNAEVAN
jgi:hypothetical protein